MAMPHGVIRKASPLKISMQNNFKPTGEFSVGFFITSILNLQPICIPDKVICILNLPKANLYSQPSSNRAVDLFPKQQKGTSAIRHLLARIVEIPLFLGIFALYLLTRDIKHTVSTWQVCGNWSNGVHSFIK